MPARQPAKPPAWLIEIPTSRNNGEKWGIPFNGTQGLPAAT